MHANVEFLAPLAKYTDEKPFAVFPLAGTEELVTGNIELESKLVDLHDIRLANLNLAENGVELHRHLSQNIRPRTNFEMEHYKDEISEFLRGKIPDNVHITTYECVLRRNFFPDKDFTTDMKDAMAVDTPANAAHIDATNKTGPDIIQRYLDHDILQAHTTQEYCFSIINTWRTLVPDLEDRPLALCDYRTANAQDLVAADRVYPHVEAEIYYIKYNEEQRWYWLPKQQTDELLVFINYRYGKGGQAKFCPHLSFDNPTASPDATIRESVETRSIVITRVS